MDGSRNKRVGIERWSKVDYLSNLPESLLCKVLLNLPTKDVVRTSVFSKSWRNLWRYVPGLEVDDCDFPDHITFVSFVDAFLDFNSESYLERFKLEYGDDLFDRANNSICEPDIVKRWINTVFNRRVKHLVVLSNMPIYVQMPPTLYTCESLVSLKLYKVELPSPMSVSLPCLKFMDLSTIKVSLDLDLETLISSCPVLESLFIDTGFCDDIQVIRVCSQSLMRFTHIFDGYMNSVIDDSVVDINAPRLQYLKLGDDRIGSFILNNTGSLVEAYIDTLNYLKFKHYFDRTDLQKRKMIRSFLEGISCVKDMTISSESLEVIYHYSECEQPIFHSLSFLRVRFDNYRWEMLPIFLERCPNLKSLAVVFTRSLEMKGIDISSASCLLSSVEYVEYELNGEAMEMKLLSYFLENSAILKKLTICFSVFMERKYECAILKQLLTIPRLSISCQVVVHRFDPHTHRVFDY